jgi:hypothetical protein
VFDTILSPNVKNNYQMDIFYLPNSRQNKNFKYLLTCIDVYSRFVFVKKLKTKDGASVFNAFELLMKQYGNPKNINVDLGSEFIYNKFLDYCENNDIQVWFSNPEQDNKNAIIERFHRTLRDLILRYEVANGKSYIDILYKLIDNYNDTYHSTIKNKPVDVWRGDEFNHQKKVFLKQSFKEGDRVRHIVKKKVFDKSSSTTNYTKKVYTITKVIGKAYYLDDLTKPYRDGELVLAVGNDKLSDYDKRNEENERNETIKRRINRA